MANMTNFCINDDCSSVAGYTAGHGIQIENGEIAVNVSDFIKTVSGSKTNNTLQAGASSTFAIDIGNLPDGFTLMGYREISVSAPTGGTIPNGVVIQWFGTTGGGKKANVKLLNTADVERTFNMQVTMIAVKL